jgi:uncharacterized membrane protein YadS
MGKVAGTIGWRAALTKSVPLFVLAFLGVTIVNSIGLIPGTMRDLMLQASQLLIVAALVGIGLHTRISELRAIGVRPFVVGLTAAFGLALATLAAIMLSAKIWDGIFGGL